MISNVLVECDIVLYPPRMRIIECVASPCFGFSFRDVTPIFQLTVKYGRDERLKINGGYCGTECYFRLHGTVSINH